MIDETLKRLLDAESEAERVLAHADGERLQIIEQAKREARAMEQQQTAHIADVHTSFLAQAELRAQQAIAEMQRRYSEQSLTMRASAQRHEQQALDEAVVLVTGIVKS